jgi:hypothetical protein
MKSAITVLFVGLAQGILSAQTVSLPLKEIPRTWNDEALRGLEVPLADAYASALHITADYYYKIPIRRIYRSYPLYSPGHEPAGYMKWLRGREPEVVWDYDATGTPLHAPPLRTREDWIRAGEIVFDAPISWDAFEVETLRNATVYRSSGMPVAKNGLMPFKGTPSERKGKSRWVTALAQGATRA